MAECTNNNGDIFNLFLGPKSCFSGSFEYLENPKMSLYVDFQSSIIRSRGQVQVNENDVLWDEKVNRIDVGLEQIKGPINPYSPNNDLHWSVLSEKKEKQIVELPHCNNFESFHSGINFFSENDLLEEFEDKIRFQIEKSDMFSGFVSMYDTNTGYSGLIGALLPLLDDAFGRKSKMNFGVGNEDPSIFELEAVVSGSVSSFLDWHSFEDVFRGLICKESDYHTSAVISLFLRQILLIPERGTDFKDLTAFLSPLSRNIFTSYLSVPFDDADDRSMTALFSSKYFSKNLAPISLCSSQISYPLHNTYISSCGISEISSNHNFFSSLSQLTTTDRIFGSTTRYFYTPSSQSLHQFFPQFFNDQILSNGRLRGPQQKVRHQPVTEIPVISILQNNQQPLHLINKVLAKRVKVSESTELMSAGVLEDDITDIRQSLHELADNYSLT